MTKLTYDAPARELELLHIEKDMHLQEKDPSAGLYYADAQGNFYKSDRLAELEVYLKQRNALNPPNINYLKHCQPELYDMKVEYDFLAEHLKWYASSKGIIEPLSKAAKDYLQKAQANRKKGPHQPIRRPDRQPDTRPGIIKFLDLMIGRTSGAMHGAITRTEEKKRRFL